uniref:Uncharacterized protein n=1 Tax=Sciurus vulgaris TaxID=55149 RepID=A0A8D2DAP5_SCIVU
MQELKTIKSNSSNVLAEGRVILLLAKGPALAMLIHQVLENPGVSVFGKLLDKSNVRELAASDIASTCRLLTVFAYGTYADYLAEARNLPPLTETQKNKL